MDLDIWHIWIIVAIILLIVEIFTVGFLTATFAIGCFLAGIMSFMGFGIKIQLLFFSVGTLIGFFGVRPFMLRFAHKKSDRIKTNADALVGKIGYVSETIDNTKNQGRIMVEGDDWRAESDKEEIIQTGNKVEVLKVNSTILIVSHLKY
ncbi:MAG TPA: NfeD family protein [Saprospiraceae bacterium]|nr:NfeD family protein [Saprospiraceae bacterium]HRO09135.1 NfeD family protein [Saprospiraceae bacterium]HRO72470.1 NfeD family protein [Saprospiraceae bacterium]HRP42451.1 NfeD family protein [Saprospiraceae bacterium]